MGYVFRPRPLDWLIVYNTNSAQSEADADWYISQRLAGRGCKIGFNFPSSTFQEQVGLLHTDYSGSTGSITCQGATYRGSTLSGYTGLTMQAALEKYANEHKSLGILFSTLTPMLYLESNWSGDSTNSRKTLATYVAFAVGYRSGWTYAAPWGRLGCSSGLSGTGWTMELVPDGASALTSGVSSLLYTATTNALVAETQDNHAKPHWGSSTLNYHPYVTTARNTEGLAWWSERGFSTVDVDTSFATGDWVGERNLFALCYGAGAGGTTYDNNLPGAHVWSDTYDVMPGAWGFRWSSIAQIDGHEILYKGGSAAFLCWKEPNSTGLIEPVDLLSALADTRMSCAEAATYECVVRSFAGTTPGTYERTFSVNRSFVVCGDPLYRPYKSTPVPGSSYGLLLPGTLKAS